MMFALGCIQARRCNSNDCPTGVATQNPALVEGLDVEDKTERVHRFHHATVHAFLELLGAAGFDEPSDLLPEHVHRRLDFHQSLNYAELFEYLQPGDLLGDRVPAPWAGAWSSARDDRF